MKSLLTEIRELIRTARVTAVHSIDLIQVLTNFEIGRRIVMHEQQGAERAGYGEATLVALARVLTDEFGSGFSVTNLKLMRGFYLTYRERIGQTPSGDSPLLQKSQTLSDQLRIYGSAGIARTAAGRFTLSWSHYVFLTSIKEDAERSFYEIEATSQGEGNTLMNGQVTVA